MEKGDGFIYSIELSVMFERSLWIFWYLRLILYPA